MASLGKTQNKAFTILELIVTLILIAIVAVVVSSRWPGTTINLNAQAQQLASDIRYTQTLSMTHTEDYQLNFINSTTYNITDTNGNIVSNPVTGSTTNSLGSGIQFTLPPNNLPNNLISFDSQGTPYIDSSTSTTLTSAAVITLSSGGKTTTVTVQPSTGRVTVP